jgi:anti-anti-sigma factor
MSDQGDRPTLEIHRIESPPSLRLVGEVDLSNAATLEQAVLAELDVGRELTLDLADCTYIGSEGIGILLLAWHQLKDGGRLVLRSPTGVVRRVLELAGLDRFPGVEIVDGGDD